MGGGGAGDRGSEPMERRLLFRDTAQTLQGPHPPRRRVFWDVCFLDGGWADLQPLTHTKTAGVTETRDSWCCDRGVPVPPPVSLNRRCGSRSSGRERLKVINGYSSISMIFTAAQISINTLLEQETRVRERKKSMPLKCPPQSVFTGAPPLPSPPMAGHGHFFPFPLSFASGGSEKCYCF